MPTTRQQRKKQSQEPHISSQAIHKLPNEILGTIFILCARLCEFSEDEPYGPYDCQTAVAAVCRRWRAAAIGTPQLWSHVTLDDPAPWDRSAIYLSRSGTVPLDIDIDMREDFWENTENGTTEECTERAQEALKFIVSHGGITSRWQSIFIITDAFGPHRAVIDFLRSSPMPELRYLRLHFEGPAELDEGDEFDLYEATRIKPLRLFQQPPSKLHTARLAGVPNPFLFGHSDQLQLPSLTYLELAFVYTPPKLSDLSALLQVTTHLEVLRFRFGRVDPTERHKLSSRLPKIHLNYLRELAFLDIRDALWPLNVVMVLEAPNVELLQLGLAECNVGDAKFAKYLVEGGNKSAPRTVFPSLICLKVLLNSGDRSASLKLESLLRAYPQITHLEIPYFPLDALLVKPWLVPNLQHLRVADRRGSEIKRVVAARARGKIPLKAVEADWFSEELIKPVERKYLAGKVDLKFFNPHEHGGVVMVYDNSQDEGDDF
ncbi:hypothetical protein FS749_003440 [Ceratobasidium sp. UAMH 11750]|nr:hypothetical protein FS749_003440 [Ceratobasidium sp. UAMH 11750]